MVSLKRRGMIERDMDREKGTCSLAIEISEVAPTSRAHSPTARSPFPA
jgi:hypothetical protein